LEPSATLRQVLTRQAIDTVLITTHYLDSFGGFPLVALDVAGALREAGASVHVAACRVANPLAAEAAARGFPVHNLHQGDRPPAMPDSVDLVWGQHWTAYGLALLQFGVATRGLVLSSLSPFEPLEAFPALADEANLLLFNSEENLAVQAPSLPSGVATRVLPNSLPASWFQGATDGGHSLRRLLVVANDLPTDMAAALVLLEGTGVACDIVGMDHGQRLVDESVLDGCDAVVTIGHTVQKALARHRPVFVYGRFGGPGWLTEVNLPLALHHNFSGRGFGRRKACGLAAEISAGFAAARVETAELGQAAHARFRLEAQLAALLGGLRPKSVPRRMDPKRHRPAMLLAQAHANLSSGAAPFPAVRNIPGGETIWMTAVLRDPPPAPPEDAVLLPKAELAARVLPSGRMRLAGTLRVRHPKRVVSLLLELPDGARAVTTLAWPLDAPRRSVVHFQGWLPAIAGEGVARLLLRDEEGTETCLAALDVSQRLDG